jgi:pSer/pThr/pTyr-binding forkhead associated (FHA) protein
LPDHPSAQPSAVVTLRIAGRPGPAFQLDTTSDNVIGRSASGLVALADRLASRRHASITFDPTTSIWSVRDLGSRNGTWLDGQQVRESVLADGQMIRVGTTELEFRTKAAAASEAVIGTDVRLLRSGSPDELQGVLLKRMARSADEARWPMLLYQCGVRLLASTSSWQTVCTTLELATEFTSATRFGWFTLAPTGALRAVCVVPPGSGLESLLTGVITTEATSGRAALVSTDTVDVAAVPLNVSRDERALLVAAAPRGGLKEADLDVLVTLAGMAGAAAAGHPSPDGGTEPMDEATETTGEDSRIEGTIALTGADLVALGIGATATPSPEGVATAASLRLGDWQRALVVEALRRSGGSVPEAAALLGISRATLYRKLDTWGLTRTGSGRSGP